MRFFFIFAVFVFLLFGASWFFSAEQRDEGNSEDVRLLASENQSGDQSIDLADDLNVLVRDLPETDLENQISGTLPIEKPSCEILDDFDAVGDWRTVNDNVMGGRSLGSFIIEDSILVHRGSINTNGGGFSSVRRPLLENSLVGYSDVTIRLDTGGRAYAVQFEDARYRNVSHRYIIESTGESGWREVSFDLQDTVPVSFGVEVDAEPFLVSAVNSLRLSLNDGIDGPFDIAVDWIKVCQ